MRYKQDKRIVATLDAGGTNFVFSAIQGTEEVVEPMEEVEMDLDTDRFAEMIRKAAIQAAGTDAATK